MERLYAKFNGKMSEYIGTVRRKDFEWAWLTVQTRAFGDDFLPFDLCLMPMMDMLNHSNEKRRYIKFQLNPSKVLAQNWDLNDKNINFSIYPNGQLKQNDEIFDEYDKIPNSKLLLMHGFAIPDNKFDEVDLTFEAANIDHKNNFGRWKLDTQLKPDCLNSDLIKFAKSIPPNDNSSE